MLMINYALETIADFNSDAKSFKLNHQKVTKIIATSLLQLK
jgi:hypothetical protein